MLALKTIYWCQIPRTVLVSNAKIEKKKSTHTNQSKSAAVDVAAAANRKTKAACTLHTQMTLYKFTTHQMRCFFLLAYVLWAASKTTTLWRRRKKNTGDEACSHRHRWTKTLMKFIWELIIGAHARITIKLMRFSIVDLLGAHLLCLEWHLVAFCLRFGKPLERFFPPNFPRQFRINLRFN